MFNSTSSSSSSSKLTSLKSRFKHRKPSKPPKPSSTSTSTSASTFTRPDLTSINPQSTSPLFSLPGELRNQIWEYALTPYNDHTRPYPSSTPYSRPDYLAPLTSSVALLRTCKATYSEAWYLPWTTAELSFYLTGTDRRPPRVETVERVQAILDDLYDKGVDSSTKRIRVFAQAYQLEEGRELSRILGMHYFRPTEVVITIRHTDFWYWERDAVLRLDGRWVGGCQLPDSVRVVKIEFESLERKKEQVDEITQQAVDHWVFRTVGGNILSAVVGKQSDGQNKGGMEVMRWTGSSNLRGLRWLRDETEHDKLNYYVKTVVWRVRDESKDTDVGSIRWTRGISATYVDPLISRIDTTTEEELAYVGKHEDKTVDELKHKIVEWRSKNPKLARRVFRTHDQ
ncbi:hypothetical protein TWF506_003719 [Arthrobotrys conoides]|uniref:Uncharacterized protein n=1 Tax=Arthrobotrys conoides TaxID=74498 RepID=A0AAN8RU37_9PEZI